MQPDSLSFYGETAESWDHAKDIVFGMYQDLRHYVPGGIPDRDKSFFYDSSLVADVEPHKESHEVDGKIITTEFPAIGILKYRGEEYVIYNDDYGMQSFIVVDGKTITVESCAGEYDWYYALDSLLDL